MKTKAVSLIAIIVVVTALILILLIAGGNNIMTNVSIDEVAFTDIRIEGEELIISGSLLNGAKSYRKYTYTVESNILYLTISAGVVNHKYPHGDFTIVIQNLELQNLSSICLKSDSKTKQIYPK